MNEFGFRIEDDYGISCIVWVRSKNLNGAIRKLYQSRNVAEIKAIL